MLWKFLSSVVAVLAIKFLTYRYHHQPGRTCWKFRSN